MATNFPWTHCLFQINFGRRGQILKSIFFLQPYASTTIFGLLSLVRIVLSDILRSKSFEQTFGHVLRTNFGKTFGKILHTFKSRSFWTHALVKCILVTLFGQAMCIFFQDTLFGQSLQSNSSQTHPLFKLFLGTLYLLNLILGTLLSEFLLTWFWSNSQANIFFFSLIKLFGQNFWSKFSWAHFLKKLSSQTVFFCFSLVKFTRFVHNFLSSLFGNNFWFIFIFFKFSSQHFSLWPQFPVKIYLGTLFGQSSLYGHSLFKILLSTLLVLFLGTFLSNPFWA